LAMLWRKTFYGPAAGPMDVKPMNSRADCNRAIGIAILIDDQAQRLLVLVCVMTRLLSEESAKLRLESRLLQYRWCLDRLRLRLRLRLLEGLRRRMWLFIVDI
jgi:hypothetical protein